MTPYGSLPYFLLSAIILIPTIIAFTLVQLKKWLILIVSIVFLTILFWGKTEEIYFFTAYTGWQCLLIGGYFKLKHRASAWYYFTVMGSLLPLIWIKLVPIVPIHSWTGFIGISYLSFKCLQMIIEIRDGQMKSFSMVDFLSFLWFFPTLSSGPIDRYRRFRKDLIPGPTRQQYWDFLYLGIERIFRGLLYKFILAYLIQTYWISLPYLHSKTFLGTLCYMYAYSFYLFFDFAGYSAFAVGFSYLLGIQSPENFNKPFLSRNIKDFWNRWHMTLSSWFRDYVYMRLLLHLTRKKVFRSKVAASYASYLCLFGLMGVWHGLQFDYIVYGIYHAVLMIASDAIERLGKQRELWKDGALMKGIGIFITFHFVCFGFLIFSGRLF